MTIPNCSRRERYRTVGSDRSSAAEMESAGGGAIRLDSGATRVDDSVDESWKGPECERHKFVNMVRWSSS